MAKLLPLKGSYWAAYPVPSRPKHCMAPRTLQQAFGPYATLNAPPSRPPRGWVWPALCFVCTVATLTLLGAGLYR